MKEDFRKMIREVEHQVVQNYIHQPDALLGICSVCDKKLTIHEFRDILSFKEYLSSGLCQRCQDETAEEGK